MKREKYPLTRIDEILYDIKEDTALTTLDLLQGYCKMDDTCKEKTTFICLQGIVQFEVMPFWLMNAQATFQKMMN